MQLETEGFRVLHAASAEAGLEVASQHELALITLDIQLPGMDGWEFLERMPTLPCLHAVPVVIVSIDPDRNKGFALGAAAILQKPISRNTMYDALTVVGLIPRARDSLLTVLAVDDHPEALAILAARLEGLAITVLRASGGQQAIDLARAELPDLILLDLMMPDVSGFDVVEALNDSADTARIPVVVLTATAVTGRDRARLNGYVSSIVETSEFDRARLLSEVRRAIALRRATS
jgi:CheY-like chemotaxis protein